MVVVLDAETVPWVRLLVESTYGPIRHRGVGYEGGPATGSRTGSREPVVVAFSLGHRTRPFWFALERAIGCWNPL